MDPPPPHLTRTIDAVTLAERAVRAKRDAKTTDACLWIGDLPRPFANHKALRMLLWHTTPPGSEQPQIRVLNNRPRKGRPYAILTTADAAAAAAAIGRLHGLLVEPSKWKADAASWAADADAAPEGSTKQKTKQLPAFTLRVKPYTRREVVGGEGRAPLDAPPAQPLQVGLDPPLVAQLRPLPMAELEARLSRLRPERPPLVDGGRGALVAALAAAYEESGGRPTVRHQPPPLPTRLVEAIEREFAALEWPGRSHRPEMASEAYIVLRSDGVDYPALRALCAEAAAVASADFAYTGIAVTRNFVGSPHIDHRDTAPQLAASFGAFEGGELCVETGDGSSVAVVETRRRIACVDGRRVHWVRTHGGGERWSLIWYSTSEDARGSKAPSWDAVREL